jgi:hypothetical protein
VYWKGLEQAMIAASNLEEYLRIYLPAVTSDRESQTDHAEN